MQHRNAFILDVIKLGVEKLLGGSMGWGLKPDSVILGYFRGTPRGKCAMVAPNRSKLDKTN